MQSPNEASQLGTEQDVRKMFNLAFILVDTWALTLEVLFRHRFGSRYLGYQCLFGIVLMIAFTGFFTGQNATVFSCFFVIVVVMMCKGRIQAVANERKGMQIHSFSAGITRLPQSAKGRQKAATGMEEAIACGLISWPLSYVDPPTGAYFFFGAICLVIKAGVIATYVRQRHRDMEDARLEGEYLASTIRPNYSRRY